MQSSDYSSSYNSTMFRILSLKILRLLKHDHYQNNVDATIGEDCKSPVFKP